MIPAAHAGAYANALAPADASAAACAHANALADADVNACAPPNYTR